MADFISRRRPAKGPARLSDWPPGLLSRARRRLYQSALVAFGFLSATQVFTFLFFVTAGEEGAYRFAPGGDALSALICLLIWLFCRSKWVNDINALRVGIAGELLLCMSLSVLSVHNGYELQGKAPSIGPESLIIAVFPLVVPISPRITAMVSFVSALMPACSILFFSRFPLEIRIAYPLPEALSASIYPCIAALIAYSAAKMRDEAYVDAEELRQEQGLLETLLAQVGTSVILINAAGRLVYANATAGQMLLTQQASPGMPLDEALNEHAKPLQKAFGEGDEATLTLMRRGEPEVLQVVRREIEVGFLAHTLLIVRRFTEEIRAREIGAYKRVIRVLVHELNNSLGPISSILNSAQKVLGHPQHAARLQSVFGVVRERVQHLVDFLERYAKLARLPAPRRKQVSWERFLAELEEIHPFRRLGELPEEEPWIDPGQMQQVMLNLLRNAEEAGGKPGESEVEVSQIGEEFCIRVSDRGEGMSEEAWKNAMTPLFSTKPKGSGLGLALCREILEAHEGRIGLFPREGGGTTVRCCLPIRPQKGEMMGGELTRVTDESA